MNPNTIKNKQKDPEVKRLDLNTARCSTYEGSFPRACSISRINSKDSKINRFSGVVTHFEP